MLVWIFYLLGQVLHMLLKAQASVASLNSPVNSYGVYFRRNGLALLVRFFAGTCLFILWSAGAGSIFGEQFLPVMSGSSLLTKAAVAGMFGLGTDSIADKVLAHFPLLEGALPPKP